MSDIYGSHFEYGGVSSRQSTIQEDVTRPGLIIASVGASRMQKLSGTISGSTIFSRISNKNFLVGDDTSNSQMKFDVEIVSDEFECIGAAARRYIEKWLFNKHEYKKLYLDDEDDCLDEMSETIDGVEKRLYLNCRLVNPEKLEYNGGVVGYKATLEADSNMYWQDAITKTFQVGNSSSGSTSTITVTVDSDMDDYIYPKVTIGVGESGGDVIIVNNTDDSTRFTQFDDLTASVTVTMNGETSYISGQNYEKFSARNFVRLLDGDNSITVTGNVSTITFEFQNRRNM